MSDSLKPCIVCEKPCEIFAIELGDSFTLTYLRLCDFKCFFEIAHEFLYSIGQHKDFRSHLYEKEDREDRKNKQKGIDAYIELSTEAFRKSLEANPNLLSTPTPALIYEMFSQKNCIPRAPGQILKFIKAKKEDRVKWAKNSIERLKESLAQSEKELQEIQNE